MDPLFTDINHSILFLCAAKAVIDRNAPMSSESIYSAERTAWECSLKILFLSHFQSTYLVS